jgi:hypothetical protein
VCVCFFCFFVCCFFNKSGDTHQSEDTVKQKGEKWSRIQRSSTKIHKMFEHEKMQPLHCGRTPYAHKRMSAHPYATGRIPYAIYGMSAHPYATGRIPYANLLALSPITKQPCSYHFIFILIQRYRSDGVKKQSIYNARNGMSFDGVVSSMLVDSCVKRELSTRSSVFQGLTLSTTICFYLFPMPGNNIGYVSALVALRH